MNRLRDLCEEIEAAIEGLDGAEWSTASLASPTWRHSKQHLDAVGSALDQHLLFSVSVESAPSTGVAGDDFVQVLADLAVRFLFKAGAGAKIARERLAMGAAAQVMGAVLRYRFTSTANVEVVNAFTPGQEIDDFLPVELRFAALVDLPYVIRS